MSAILLDTHAFIWLSDDSPNLPLSLRTKLESTETVFVSIASFWEISIKVSLGKISLKEDFTVVTKRFSETRFTLLPISIQDTATLQKLPLHHRDPFDRILIAQAVNHRISIASRDKDFSA